MTIKSKPTLIGLNPSTLVYEPLAGMLKGFSFSVAGKREGTAQLLAALETLSFQSFGLHLQCDHFTTVQRVERVQTGQKVQIQG